MGFKKQKILVLCCLIAASCQKDDTDRRAFIEREIWYRVETRRAQKESECRLVALEKANKIVDSLLIAQNALRDANLSVQKPQKPTKIDIKSDIDTLPVVPLIPKK